jgi:hypothetical protein
MGHKVRRQQSYFKNEKPRLSGFSDGQSLASQGSPAEIVSAGCRTPVRGWSHRTWALLAGSEAPDSLNREPRASLAAILICS